MTTMLEVLDTLKIDYRTAGQHHHVNPGWVGTDCPDCSPGWNKFRLGFNLRSGYATCWSCGPKYAPKVLSAISGVPFHKVKALLEGVVRVYEPSDAPNVSGKLIVPFELFPLKVCLAHSHYLLKRKLSPQVVTRLWGLKAVRLAGPQSWSVFIPIIYKGETVSWTLRSIGNAWRYHSAKPSQEKYHHKDLLFGEDYCRHSVVVHEGPFDVFRTGPGAVATMGTGWTRKQLARLSRYPVRVVCFDNTPDGRARAVKLTNELSPFPGDTYMVTLDSKDAGSATETELEILRGYLQ